MGEGGVKVKQKGAAGHARILSRDSHGEKVLLLTDGTIMKLFRWKHWLSSALVQPHQKTGGSCRELERGLFRRLGSDPPPSGVP